MTYDFAKKLSIPLLTPSTSWYPWTVNPIPGVSISTTRWPSSSNSLDAWTPWLQAVFRRDPLALFTNYSCNRWSLEIDHTDCPHYRGFPKPLPSYHTRSKGWPSQTLHERDIVTYAISAGGSSTRPGVKLLVVDGISGSPTFEPWTAGC